MPEHACAQGFDPLQLALIRHSPKVTLGHWLTAVIVPNAQAFKFWNQRLTTISRPPTRALTIQSLSTTKSSVQQVASCPIVIPQT